MTEATFKKTIWKHYRDHGRTMPWRSTITPYHIVVSEIMLQQTQVSRVEKKFISFIKNFPSFKTLAQASLQDVLTEWQGLGYNRRGLNLHRLANIVMEKHGGKLPKTYEELVELPGIGPNTAGSILAFAFNIPHSFIETNIRTVFIHFFFKNSKTKVDDKKLLPLIVKTLDQKKPREWYWALMDYGAYLKNTVANPSRKSVHHVKQTTFKGSNRELRAQILQAVLKSPVNLKDIEKKLDKNSSQNIQRNLDDLVREGFLHIQKGVYVIGK